MLTCCKQTVPILYFHAEKPHRIYWWQTQACHVPWRIVLLICNEIIQSAKVTVISCDLRGVCPLEEMAQNSPLKNLTTFFTNKFCCGTFFLVNFPFPYQVKVVPPSSLAPSRYRIDAPGNPFSLPLSFSLSVTRTHLRSTHDVDLLLMQHKDQNRKRNISTSMYKCILNSFKQNI